MKDAFYVDYLERLENLGRDLHAEIAGLPTEAMDWVPGPEMNSVAVLLAHTTGSLRFWIGDGALGDPSDRVRAREFETRGESGAEMLGRLEAVIDYARAKLPNLGLEDLGQEVTVRERTVTRGWALLHALEHGYLHLGHMQMTVQLWRIKMGT